MLGGLVVALALMLGACGTAYLEQRTDQRQDAADVVRSANFQPTFPTPVRDDGKSSAATGGFSIFGATATALAPASQAAEGEPPSQAADVAGGHMLNFENAPVAAVVKAVLGDDLQLAYIIDPRAQGAITLDSGRPIAKKDLLMVLESALRANNLLLIREGAGYRVAPASEGAIGGMDASPGSRSVEPGYGLSAMPLQYISGATVTRLLEGFAARPGALRTDPTGRVVLVVGTAAERRSAIDTVRSFDVDWMRGQSVGMYPVRNSEPDPIVAELEKIMDSQEGGLGHDMVKFLPVARQNAVLVVAARPDLLKSAARWIEKLDSPSTGGADVKVYKVRHGDAKQIAQLLNNIFLRGAGAGGEASELAPGSGASKLSTTQRLTGGATSSPSPGGAGSAGTSTTAGASPGATSGGAITSGQGGASPFGGIATQALGNAFASENGGGANGAVLPGVRITADPANNTILIYASAENYHIIERTLNQLDRPQAQVAIDVTIAEVTLNDQLNYGVQFYLSNNAGALVNSANTTNAIPALQSTAPPGFNVFVGNGATPEAVVNALHQLTDVKILSNPSLVVVDNQEASLEVGDQVPISTGSATVLSANNAVVNTVDYTNTGIILHVLPRISPDSSVLLDIEQEISSVPENSANLTPTISQRKVKSEISVNDGQMVMLAGLVSDQQTKSRMGIPILDQTPIIGGAFGTTAKTTARTELIVLIRPKIIRDGVDASVVAEQLRAKLRSGKMDAVTLPGALNVLSR